MKNDLVSKMIYDYNSSNLRELLFMKQEIIKLNEELRQINEVKNSKEKRINDIKERCSDTFIVKIPEFCGDEEIINYYCLFCENKVSNDDDFINQEGRYIIDFSDFKFDEGNLTIENKLEIVYEMMRVIKESNPNASNEEIVRYVNESIKEEDDFVKEKVMKKLLESINVFPKRKVLQQKRVKSLFYKN